VSQIYIGQKNKLAIINGQKVQQGDRVDGAEVLAIKSDRVKLRINGKLTEITIMPSIKKYTE
jgi:peroxiredoxin